jgi:hypothetical protein
MMSGYTFQEFPPRQKSSSFTIHDALAKMAEREFGVPRLVTR